MILSTDEAAIMQVPTMRGGRVPTRTAPAGQDKDVAETTGLMSRAGNGPAGCGGSSAGSSRPAATWQT
jgi:hypothetical protein